MDFKILAAILVLTFAYGECSKILFIHTSFSRSHVLPMQVLAKALAKRGHEITFVSGFPFEKPIENYRDIKMHLSDEDSQEIEDMGKNPEAKNFFTLLGFFARMFYKVGNETLQSADVRKLMDEEQFDLVFTGYFMTEYLLGLATHFDCPSIVFFSGNVMSPLHKMVGNPLSPTGAPHAMLKSKEINTFALRLKNFLMHGFDLLVMRPYFNYRARQIYE
jgi:UDP:flavonoid glycosyltransferase YjiC (YdhE family)